MHARILCKYEGKSTTCMYMVYEILMSVIATLGFCSCYIIATPHFLLVAIATNKPLLVAIATNKRCGVAILYIMLQYMINGFTLIATLLTLHMSAYAVQLAIAISGASMPDLLQLLLSTTLVAMYVCLHVCVYACACVCVCVCMLYVCGACDVRVHHYMRYSNIYSLQIMIFIAKYTYSYDHIILFDVLD